MENLKPCPFCGYDGETANFTILKEKDEREHIADSYWVSCGICDNTGPRRNSEENVGYN